MTKVQIPSNFYYDPQRQGFNENLWKAISGAPSIVSEKLRISSAEIVHFGDVLHGFFNLVANVPATPTNAILTGGTSATSVFGTWAAVTDGDFAITIEGVTYDITAIDFTGAGDMDAVAVILQAAIRTATGDSFTTVVWDTDHFIITSRKSITVTSASPTNPGTDISGAGGTAFMDCDTGNGVVTDATNSNKIWGLTQPNKGIKCYFELRGAVLILVTSDETGTVEETEVEWNDSLWTGNDIKFEIDWSGLGVKFKINGDNINFHETRVPRSPLSLYVYNTMADNFDFKYFESKDTGSVF